MEALAQDICRDKTAYPQFGAVETTIYEIIEAICNEVEPEEDWLVTEVVLSMVKNSRIRNSIP